MPTVSTEAPSSLTATSATLNAAVNPNGEEVAECEFQYGTTTAYGSSLPCTPSPGSGREPVAVSASLTGLAANAVYHFRVVATNPTGTAYGSDQTVSMPADVPPTVTTEAPSAVAQSSATLNATVNPNGGTVTSCAFEFDSSEELLPCVTMPGSGEAPVAVSAPVGGLTGGTTYSYRLVAGNQSGTVYGSIQTFTTPPSSTSPLTVSVPPFTPSPAPNATLAGTTLVLGADGAVTVKVRCTASDAQCAGTITLRTLNAVSTAVSGQPAAKRVLTLAAGPFKVPGGRVAAVKLSLSGKARGLLARERILHARATILAHDLSGAADTGNTTVTIRAASGTHRSVESRGHSG